MTWGEAASLLGGTITVIGVAGSIRVLFYRVSSLEAGRREDRARLKVAEDKVAAIKELLSEMRANLSWIRSRLAE